VRIGKDRLQFSILSSTSGYAYVFVVGTNQSDFYLIFPNSIDVDNAIPAGRRIAVPRRLPLDANGPPGVNHFVAIVSDNRRDFTSLAIRRSGGFFEEFQPGSIAAAASTAGGVAALFAGNTTCPGRTDCSAAYGAAEFSIEEILQ
jgi:hypothetical protein